MGKEEDSEAPHGISNMTRREFLVASTAAAAVAGCAGPGQLTSGEPSREQQSNLAKVSFTVNGKIRELDLDLRPPWLAGLREHLHPTARRRAATRVNAARAR